MLPMLNLVFVFLTLCQVFAVQLPRDERCPAHTKERVHCPGHAKTCSLARLNGCSREGMYCCENKCNDAVCFDRHGSIVNVESYRYDNYQTHFSREQNRNNNRDFSRNKNSPVGDAAQFDTGRQSRTFSAVAAEFDRSKRFREAPE